MDEGLRERKKRETRERISDMAMGLFMARGFDNVTVAEVARAADVSVNTVFNYFPAKEDLFLDRQDQVESMPVEVAQGRAPNESVVRAFRRDFLDALETRDWRYGLNEGSDVFARMVAGSPALRARTRELHLRRETLLAAALAEETGADDDDLTPRLLAAHLLNTTRLLSDYAMRRTLAGEGWETIRPDLRIQAGRAFDLLESGLGNQSRLPVSAAPPRTRKTSP